MADARPLCQRYASFLRKGMRLDHLSSWHAAVDGQYWANDDSFQPKPAKPEPKRII
jgi:hypothetical protein